MPHISCLEREVLGTPLIPACAQQKTAQTLAGKFSWHHALNIYTRKTVSVFIHLKEFHACQIKFSKQHNM